MDPRSEPLLWIQLIAVGLLPLEALLLLLVLAGSDPGPVPAIERVLCWGIGVLAPALLLWRRPADVWSLLLVQTPLRGRRNLQQRLSSLQEALPLRLGLVMGATLALPLLWWLDRNAAMASAFSPLAGSPRLVGMLVASLLLTLMLWQWQQILQTLWLLSRSPAAIAAAPAMDQAALEEKRLSLGIPLLLPTPLRASEPGVEARTGNLPREAGPPPSSPQEPPAAQEEDARQGDWAEPEEPAASKEPSAGEGGEAEAGDVSADAPVAVEPEKSAAEDEGGALDQQVG